MFSKFKRKKPETASAEGVEDTESIDTQVENSGIPTKKKFSSTDLVFGGGLVLIVGGMFWVFSGGLSGEPATTQTTTAKQDNTTIEQSKKVEPTSVADAQKGSEEVVELISTTKQSVPKEPAPYAYESQLGFGSEGLEPPPDSYEQNNTAIAKTVAKTEPAEAPKRETQLEPKIEKTQKVAIEPRKPTTPVATESLPQVAPKQSNRAASVPEPQLVPPVAQAEQAEAPIDEASAKYVCSMVEAYQDMVGKEIMYYTKDKARHTYVPAYNQANWDESGVVVQKRLMAIEIDVKERMVEVSRGKWIPALEFMHCVMLEENRQ